MTNIFFFFSEVLVEDTVCICKRYTKQATIGMLGAMSERTFDMKKELCACYIEWQEAFDLGNWILLKQILYIHHSLTCTQEA